MPTLEEWKHMTTTERGVFLKDPHKFTSYSDEDYELAENVVEDLRQQLDNKIGKVSIANKGGYLIFEIYVEENTYDFVTSKSIYNHLGFDVFYYKEPLNSN
jgi:hypothetical protein